jgi:hypothetical protein
MPIPDELDFLLRHAVRRIKGHPLPHYDSMFGSYFLLGMPQLECSVEAGEMVLYADANTGDST